MIISDGGMRDANIIMRWGGAAYVQATEVLHMFLFCRLGLDAPQLEACIPTIVLATIPTTGNYVGLHINPTVLLRQTVTNAT